MVYQEREVDFFVGPLNPNAKIKAVTDIFKNEEHAL